jgi:hypothetical protein
MPQVVRQSPSQPARIVPVWRQPASDVPRLLRAKRDGLVCRLSRHERVGEFRAEIARSPRWFCSGGGRNGKRYQSEKEQD